MTYPEVVKYLAGVCFRANKSDITAATEEFQALITRAGFHLPANPWNFVQLWGPRLGSDGFIQSHAALSGQKRKLTDDDAVVLYVQALGWYDQGLPGPYESVEQFMQINEVVKHIAADTGISGRTITRRLKEIDPKFHYGKVRRKAYLDEQHRAWRLAGVEENRPIIGDRGALVVWADEKVMCMNQEKCMGWISSEHEDYAFALPIVTHQGRVVKLKYIIAVNYICGPVFFKFFTGTSGMPADRDDKAYRVSISSETAWACCLLSHAAMRVLEPQTI